MAPVDGQYKLTSVRPSPEVPKERVAAIVGSGTACSQWDVAEINGLASMLHGNGYLEQSTAVYRRAVQL
jgi:hypothetical protein